MAPDVSRCDTKVNRTSLQPSVPLPSRGHQHRRRGRGRLFEQPPFGHAGLVETERFSDGRPLMFATYAPPIGGPCATRCTAPWVCSSHARRTRTTRPSSTTAAASTCPRRSTELRRRAAHPVIESEGPAVTPCRGPFGMCSRRSGCGLNLDFSHRNRLPRPRRHGMSRRETIGAPVLRIHLRRRQRLCADVT
jgi:hypothetical protein